MNQLNVDKIQKIPDENQQKIIQSILSNHQANISHFLTKKKKKNITTFSDVLISCNTDNEIDQFRVLLMH